MENSRAGSGLVPYKAPNLIMGASPTDTIKLSVGILEFNV